VPKEERKKENLDNGSPREGQGRKRQQRKER
jgi:hypothetical protein